MVMLQCAPRRLQYTPPTNVVTFHFQFLRVNKKKLLVFGDEFLAQGLHLKSHQKCSAVFLQTSQGLPH